MTEMHGDTPTSQQVSNAAADGPRVVGRLTRYTLDSGDLEQALRTTLRAVELHAESATNPAATAYALDQANLARGFLDDLLVRHKRPFVARPKDNPDELGPKKRRERKVRAQTVKAKNAADRYNRLKAAKLCVKGDGNPAREGSVLCGDHLNRNATRTEKARTDERQTLGEIKAKR